MISEEEKPDVPKVVRTIDLACLKEIIELEQLNWSPLSLVSAVVDIYLVLS